MTDDDKKKTQDPRERHKNKVQEGSEESFPASDPPSYNPGSPGAPPHEKGREKGKAGPSDNVARLRDEIDSGSTGDKVPAPDPAAAPLGTDDEAAGASPKAEEIARARRHERRR